jgi:hypothetical protein
MSTATRIIEKRREPRRPARGLVTLRIPGPRAAQIQGQLVDVSDGGFRASHDNASLEPGQVVEFEHQHQKGSARAVWNRISGSSIQTGFLIL